MKLILSRLLLCLCIGIAGFAVGRFTKNCTVSERIRFNNGYTIITPKIGDIEYDGVATRMYINGEWRIIDSTNPHYNQLFKTYR